MAIGDSLNDLCMIKEAGTGVAFCSGNELLNHHADVIISTPDFSELLNHTSAPVKIRIENSVRRLTLNISGQGTRFFEVISTAVKRISKN